MKAITKKRWALYDWFVGDGKVDTTHTFILEPGEHEVEIVPDPLWAGRGNWIVLKGTKIGWPIAEWFKWIELKISAELARYKIELTGYHEPPIG